MVVVVVLENATGGLIGHNEVGKLRVSKVDMSKVSHNEIQDDEEKKGELVACRNDFNPS